MATEAEADTNAGYSGHPYGRYHGYYGHHLGKRSANAEAAPEAESLYGYGGHYGSYYPNIYSSYPSHIYLAQPYR